MASKIPDGPRLPNETYRQYVDRVRKERQRAYNIKHKLKKYETLGRFDLSDKDIPSGALRYFACGYVVEGNHLVFVKKDGTRNIILMFRRSLRK